jgi:PAS domain S-box-containing protein
MDMLKRGENIEVPLVSGMPDEWASERSMLEPQGIQSLILIPLFIESTLMGFVGLDSVRNTKTYSQSEINTLRVWGSMLISLVNRKKNERQLEQTRQNLQTFFDSIDDILWVIDADENIIYANPASERSLGYTLDEILDKPVLNMHPEEDRDEVHRVVWEILNGKKRSMNFPLLHKNGRLIPVDTKLKRGYWNDAPAIYAISKDLTEIQVSEKKFSTAFHANPTMMAISRTRDGVYLDVNNTFTETLGYSADELIGHSDKELHLLVDPELKEKIIQMALEGKVLRKEEMQMRTKSGDIRTGLLSADSIYVGDEQCVITVSVDITDRKKAEIELLAARQEAELANLAKSEFLSRMSHELRTPMNSILGFAQLLELGTLNNSQRKGVNHILHSGRHLLDLINEVLDISRIEAGRLALSLEPVDVSLIMQEALDIIQPLALKNQVVVHPLPVFQKPLFVHSDHQRLKQILLNLLNNAVKYNKQGGSLKLDAVQMPPEEGKPLRVRMLVTDTGIGIRPENLSRIFEAFERIGAEKSEQEGTGLGLSVVKKLVTALNGSIGVESEPEVGSTFWVEFNGAESPTERLNQPQLKEMTEKQLNGKSGTLLYVEDNASNIDLVEEILAVQHAGIELVTTKWGREAYDLAKSCQPKLILLDLNLPDIPGEEALQQLLGNQETKNIPVVVISADAMPRQTERLLKAGARKFLTKPIDIAEFLEVVAHYFTE